LNKASFPTVYLPSREYFLALSQYDAVAIDTDENWMRQTVRNRAFILSTNGLYCLNIPVEKSRSAKQLTRDVRISYNDPWIRVHKGAISSAYNVSAFFEFFKEDMWAIYDRKPEFLIDLNFAFLELLVKKFKLKTTLNSSRFTEVVEERTELASASTTEAVQMDISAMRSYPQVFGHKHPFLPNLSGLDILANTGSLF
jgi:hypothetical protein